MILANTGQALPGIPGAGSGRISEWKEVPSGGEAPFEFTSGEKQRHKVSSWGGDLLENVSWMSCNITVRFHRISRVRCAVVSVVETECVSVTNEQRDLFFFKRGIIWSLLYYTPSPHLSIHSSIHPSIPSHSIPSHSFIHLIPSHPSVLYPSIPSLPIHPSHPINLFTQFSLISSCWFDLALTQASKGQSL